MVENSFRGPSRGPPLERAKTELPDDKFAKARVFGERVRTALARDPVLDSCDPESAGAEIAGFTKFAGTRLSAPPTGSGGLLDVCALSGLGFLLLYEALKIWGTPELCWLCRLCWS